jgi:hypothetical protein
VRRDAARMEANRRSWDEALGRGAAGSRRLPVLRSGDVPSRPRGAAADRLTTGTGAELPPTTTYQWSWPVAEVVSALIDTGLRVSRLPELPVSPFQLVPGMVRHADGWWRVPGDPVPLLYEAA